MERDSVVQPVELEDGSSVPIFSDVSTCDGFLTGFGNRANSGVDTVSPL